MIKNKRPLSPLLNNNLLINDQNSNINNFELNNNFKDIIKNLSKNKKSQKPKINKTHLDPKESKTNDLK